MVNSEQLLYTVDIRTGKMIEASRLQSLVNHAPAVVGDKVNVPAPLAKALDQLLQPGGTEFTDHDRQCLQASVLDEVCA